MALISLFLKGKTGPREHLSRNSIWRPSSLQKVKKMKKGHLDSCKRRLQKESENLSVATARKELKWWPQLGPKARFSLLSS